jgi:hypothetical protein
MAEQTILFNKFLGTLQLYFSMSKFYGILFQFETKNTLGKNSKHQAGNTKGGSITVLLTSRLTGLD